MTTEKRTHWTHALIHRKWTPREAKGVYEAIIGACRAHGQRLLMVDTRHYPGMPSTTDDFQEVEALIDLGFGDLIRIAVVDLPERRDANQLYETMAHNRGLNIRFFDLPEDAEAWLSATC